MSATAHAPHINPHTGEELHVAGNPLARKLAAIIKKVKFVEKDGRNEHFGYGFTSEAALLSAVREHFADAHIAIIPRALPESLVVTPGQGKKNDEIVTTLMVEFTIIDGESGVREIGCYPGCGSDKLDKGPYKAMTGAEKYFYQKLLLLPMGDDPEKPSRDDAPTSQPATRQLGQAAPAAQTGPRQLGAPAQIPTAAPPTSGPRPLGSARPAPAQPVPAPSSPPAGPRPLGQAAAPAPVAAQAPVAAPPADSRPVVALKTVTLKREGTKPQSGTPFKLFRVESTTGQRFAAFDDEKGALGSALAAAFAARRSLSVRLTTEDTQYGPKIIAFEAVS